MKSQSRVNKGNHTKVESLQFLSCSLSHSKLKNNVRRGDAATSSPSLS
jgi:hypothetical protein